MVAQCRVLRAFNVREQRPVAHGGVAPARGVVEQRALPCSRIEFPRRVEVEGAGADRDQTRSGGVLTQCTESDGGVGRCGVGEQRFGPHGGVLVPLIPGSQGPVTDRGVLHSGGMSQRLEAHPSVVGTGFGCLQSALAHRHVERALRQIAQAQVAPGRVRRFGAHAPCEFTVHPELQRREIRRANELRARIDPRISGQRPRIARMPSVQSVRHAQQLRGAHDRVIAAPRRVRFGFEKMGP